MPNGPSAMKLRLNTPILIPFVLLVSVACINDSGPAPDHDDVDPPGERVLSIAPIAQQTAVWCWAASAEMVFRFFQMPNLNPGGNYQCGIVGAYSWLRFGALHPCVNDCFQCVAPIANTAEMRFLLENYAAAASFVGIPSSDLSSTQTFGPLTFEALQVEIASGRPVLAGVNLQPQFSLPGVSKHLVVIVGYSTIGGQRLVAVNDPYPFARAGVTPNPYSLAGATMPSPGRYILTYEALVGQIDWDNTIYRIAP